jgi:phytoene dehydrogenase-like protein
VRGVVLANGDEIPAGAVVSAADPKHTLLSLLDATALSPDDHLRVRCFRAKGMASKVHLALRGLPRFRGFDDGDASRLQGRIQVGPEIDSLERAFDAWKYGEISPSPYLDITIPSLTDPSLAPAGRHVMSIHVQYTPRDLRSGDWSQRRDEVRDVALRALAPYAPDLAERVEHAQVLTPADLETTYGLTGGHPHHGEHALDQLFTMRPLWGWPAYRTPVRGLYLCSAGTHPGGGVTGLPAANAAKVIAAELRSAR